MIEEELNSILKKNFPDSEVVVENQSHLHAGHASSPESGESHFEVKIVSDRFLGMIRIERHRFVKSLVDQLFDEGLHALSLKLYTSKEYF